MDSSGLVVPYDGTDQADVEVDEDDNEEYTGDECSCSSDEGCDEGADEYCGFDCFDGFYGIYHETYEPETQRKAREVRRRLPEGYIIKQVEASHKKPCSVCRKKDWTYGEWFIYYNPEPCGTPKVCLECADTWLILRQGRGNAAMPRASEGNPLLGSGGNDDEEGEGELGSGQREATQAGGAGQAAAVAAQANGAEVVRAPAQGADAIRTPAKVDRVSGRSAAHTPVLKEDPDTVLTPAVKTEDPGSVRTPVVKQEECDTVLNPVVKEDPDTKHFSETDVLTPPHPVRLKARENLPRAPEVERQHAALLWGGFYGAYKPEIRGKVADIESRLPPGFVIRPVLAEHTKPCCECNKTLWLPGEGYISYDPYSYGTDKVCVNCFDVWLVRKEGEAKADAAPARQSNGSAAAEPQLSTLLEGDGAGPASPHQPSKEGKGRMLELFEQLVKRSRLA